MLFTPDDTYSSHHSTCPNHLLDQVKACPACGMYLVKGDGCDR